MAQEPKAECGMQTNLRKKLTCLFAKLFRIHCTSHTRIRENLPNTQKWHAEQCEYRSTIPSRAALLVAGTVALIIHRWRQAPAVLFQ
ncbi:hypothetical protein LPY66_10065 [Dehalobacter sp. DCM]|uniref:hypothetical protein n=1 Tax=Dehalobacter sp. DCM TaxID=2907827 RepID=UPI003081E38E|nr:hypothetical protein LPY66_10065 [Dehalobacter sp. DCM]